MRGLLYLYGYIIDLYSVSLKIVCFFLGPVMLDEFVEYAKSKESELI